MTFRTAATGPSAAPQSGQLLPFTGRRIKPAAKFCGNFLRCHGFGTEDVEPTLEHRPNRGEDGIALADSLHRFDGVAASGPHKRRAHHVGPSAKGCQQRQLTRLSGGEVGADYCHGRSDITASIRENELHWIKS